MQKRHLFAVLCAGFLQVIPPYAAYGEVSVETSHNVIDINYDFEIPQITGLSPDIKEKINTAILRDIISTCDDISPWASMGKETLSSQTRFISAYHNKSIISLRGSYNYYCRGPYPNAGQHFLSYDTDSGNKISLKDIFKDWKKQRDQILALFYPAQQSVIKEESCADNYRNLSTDRMLSFDFLFTDKGLLVRPDYPHVSDACEDGFESVVSYSKLLPFAQQTGLIAKAAAEAPKSSPVLSR